MESNLFFTFRNKEYSCNVCIDNSEYPCYVFVTLDDTSLINEFGEEITLKTDAEKTLPRNDDYPELIELRRSIFNVVKMLPEFICEKSKLIKQAQSQSSLLGHQAYQ